MEGPYCHIQADRFFFSAGLDRIADLISPCFGKYISCASTARVVVRIFWPLRSKLFAPRLTRLCRTWFTADCGCSEDEPKALPVRSVRSADNTLKLSYPARDKATTPTKWFVHVRAPDVSTLACCSLLFFTSLPTHARQQNTRCSVVLLQVKPRNLT